MGIHDYSCFLCLYEGEQNLINWKNQTEDYDDEEFGQNSAYLFLYSNNPIGKFPIPDECRKVEYDWNSWDFSDQSSTEYKYIDVLMYGIVQ